MVQEVHRLKSAGRMTEVCNVASRLPTITSSTARSDHRGHAGASCQGSSSTDHRGAGHCSCAHAKKSRPSGSLIVRCSLERTIHGRSGSCSVIVKPYSRKANICSHACQDPNRRPSIGTLVPRRRSAVSSEAWWLWTASRSAVGRSHSHTTTATRRASRSPRSPAGSDAQKPPSRRTSTTRLMLTKGPAGTGGQGRRSRTPESPARRGTTRRRPSPTDFFCAGLAVQHLR